MKNCVYMICSFFLMMMALLSKRSCLCRRKRFILYITIE